MKSSPADLTGRRILIVEDDFLIAQLIVDFVEEAGAEILGPFGTIDESIDFIESNAQRIDAAILDVNLHGLKSYPIADALAARSVRFVFTTGYGGGVLEERYQRHVRCEKPIHRATLLSALVALTA